MTNLMLAGWSPWGSVCRQDGAGFKFCSDHMTTAERHAVRRMNPWVFFATQIGALVIMSGEEGPEGQTEKQSLPWLRSAVNVLGVDSPWHARRGSWEGRIGEAAHFGPLTIFSPSVERSAVSEKNKKARDAWTIGAVSRVSLSRAATAR